MRALVRLALAGALLLLAGGTVVAPHVDPPDRTPWHVDHVASAYRSVLATGLGADEDGAALASVEPPHGAKTAVAVVSLLGALPLVAFPRALLRVGPAASPLPAPCWGPAAPHGPPRSSGLV